jgi:phage gp45-like
MARQEGSKVITCSNAKCGHRMVGFPGEQVVCKKCGTKIRLTKAVLAESSAKKPAEKAPKKADKTAKKTVKVAKSEKADKKPTKVKRGK